MTLLLSPVAGLARNPAKVFPEWLLVGGFSAVGIAAALWYSARSSKGTRIALGTAILVWLTALTVPFSSYFWSFHDYPWAAAVPMLVAFLVAAWRCRQRLTAVLLVAFLLFWFQGAAQPPRLTLPATLRQDGLVVTVRSLQRSGVVLFCGFEVAGSGPRDDLRAMSLEGSAGPLSIHCWPPHRWLEGDPNEPDPPSFSAYTFTPGWARTLDLSIAIPAWPSRPAAALTLPHPRPGEPSVSAVEEGNGVRLEVEGLRWATTQTSSPARRCLALRIRRSGGDPFDGALRVTDENGTEIPLSSWGMSGDQDAVTSDLELSPIPAGSRMILIHAYTGAQRAGHRRVFRFRGLPNGG